MTRRGGSATPLRLVRRALLIFFALGLVGIGALYLLGRPASAPPEIADEADELATPRGVGKVPERDPVVLSEGFEYEQRVGERSAFRLLGARFATDSAGLVNLEGVKLELTREQGDTYRVESRRATYDPQSGEARLAGDVQLAGGRGFQLSADRLDLVEGGRTVVSRGAVRFQLGEGLGGRASAMRFEFEQDRFLLRGRVRVGGQEEGAPGPLALEADLIVYQRDRRLLEATGGVHLAAGADHLRAAALEARLTEDEGTLRSAAAHGGVTGTLAGDDPDRERLRFAGDAVQVDFAGDPARAERIVLDGAPARAALQAADGVVRTLTAPQITTRLSAGRPAAVEATGGVRLVERAAGEDQPRRTVQAERAEAGFAADGEVASVRFAGDVALREPRLRATGERAELDVARGTGSLFGGRELAHAWNERGDVRAPRIDFERDGGRARATGGVLASLAPESTGVRLGPGSAAAREPVRVEATAGDWSQEDGRWSFRGDVRGSQGESLLFADQLSGDAERGQATATGNVKTVWQEAAAPGGEPPATTTVTAERLDYRRDAGEIEYTGAVDVRQQGRRMACARVLVELDAEQRARRLVATGGVRIEDPAAGRTVTGTRAEHDLAARQVLVEGEPVVLAETGGTTVRGRRLLYDLAAGNARMLAAEEAAP